MNLKTLAVLIVVANGFAAAAQIYETNGDFVQTFAGSGFSGHVDGQGTQTMFNGPITIVADTSGNLFAFDYYNNCIRKITPDGEVTTFAGGGTGSLPGYGTNIIFPTSAAIAMAIDHSNALYFVEYPTGKALFRVGSDGYVTRTPLNTLAGGQVRNGICVDSGNNVYIADSNGNKIYRYRTNGVLEVFAGSGNPGSVDGNGIFTSFSSPSVLAADSADNIYVWDSGLIRRINQNRDVSTIAGHQYSDSVDGFGTNAGFYGVSAMCADNAGDLFLASWSTSGGSAIRKVSATTNVTTIAGSFTAHGYANGIGSAARFDFGNEGICLSQGSIYVSDAGNQRIRSITNNPLPQVVSGANLGIGTFAGVTITGGVGRTYQIQSSPDLNAWTTRATVLLNSSPYLWIDQNPIAGNKFYQAVMLP